MTKKISEEAVIANALISTNRGSLTKDQVYHYWHIVDSLLPEGYYTYGNNNSFSNFCEEYPFLVNSVGDTMMINCDNTLLERYFRMGLPTKIAKVFDAAGVELNKVESKGSEQINVMVKTLKN